MRVLTRRVERVRVRHGIVVADRRTRLDGVRDEAVVDDVERDDVGRRLDRRIRGSLIAELPVVADVPRNVVPNERGAFRRRLRGARHGRQRLVVDVHQGRPCLRLGLRLGHDERDLVTHVTYAIRDQGRMRRLVHRRAVLAVDLPSARQPTDSVLCHVRAREHRDDARCGLCLGGIDRDDLGVRLG